MLPRSQINSSFQSEMPGISGQTGEGAGDALTL